MLITKTVSNGRGGVFFAGDKVDQADIDRIGIPAICYKAEPKPKVKKRKPKTEQTSKQVTKLTKTIKGDSADAPATD